MNKQFSKRLSLLMVLVMVLGLMPIFSSAQSTDLAGHWAGDVVSEWMSKGLISGYPDGAFKPDATMTRAEFMTIVNKVYNFTSEKDISFTDVKSNEWYYAVVKKAVAAGYISGYPDGRMLPNQPIQRQEVAAIFCKLESLNVDLQVAEQFKDVAGTSWAKGYIGAAVKAGYFSGYGNGLFKATAGIKRAEAVVATNKLDNARAVSYAKSGTFGPATGTEFVSKSVIVKADGVILQNLTIKGDLTIDESVGEGDVSLNNVVVQGQVYIKGGGVNSVKINGGSYGKVFIMKQSDTPVRLFVVNVKNLDVVIPQEAGGGQIVLEGVFNSVSVLAAKIQLSTQGNTTINELKMDKLALEVKVNLGGSTVVMKLITEVVMTVLGQGRIVVADVRVTGVTFEKAPETVNTTVNGSTTTTTAPPATTPSTGGGGTSSGGDSGGGSTTLPVAATPTSNRTAGYLASGSSITLSTSTSTAAIYYTIDDSTPTTASTLYTAPFTVTGASVTVKAIAVLSGYTNSAVFSATYYKVPNTADVSVASGSAIFIFEFFADSAKTMAIPYADMIDPSLIALDLTNSTVALALTSNAAIVTSTSAVTFHDLGINVTSGSVTFTSGGAIVSKFGSITGGAWTAFPNTVILNLVFTGGQIVLPEIKLELTTEEITIIQNVMAVSYAPTLLNHYMANSFDRLRL